MDELNDNTDDEDQDDNEVVTSSMNKAQTLLIQKSVNNHSEIASEYAYHDVKKEPV